jgi:hypothetical protein
MNKITSLGTGLTIALTALALAPVAAPAVAASSGSTSATPAAAKTAAVASTATPQSGGSGYWVRRRICSSRGCRWIRVWVGA